MMRMHKNGEVLTVTYDRQEMEEARKYWTKERIRTARPLVHELSNQQVDVSTTCKAVQPSHDADVTTAPYWCGGAIFGSLYGLTVKGSAQVVGENNIVMTVGHCVYGNAGKEASPDWLTNLVFYRGYGNEQEQQIMPIQSVSIYADWKDKADHAVDYAFLVTEEDCARKQHLSYVLNMPVSEATAIGYPQDIKEGKVMQKVTSPISPTSSENIMAMTETPFASGASGGAWLDSEQNVVGLGSFTIKELPNMMFGPLLNERFAALYEYVVQHKCQEDE